MPIYKIDFSYKLPEWGDIEFFAHDPDEAEEMAIAEIEELYPELEDITINGVREIKDGN